MYQSPSSELVAVPSSQCWGRKVRRKLSFLIYRLPLPWGPIQRATYYNFTNNTNKHLRIVEPVCFRRGNDACLR